MCAEGEKNNCDGFNCVIPSQNYRKRRSRKTSCLIKILAILKLSHCEVTRQFPILADSADMVRICYIFQAEECIDKDVLLHHLSHEYLYPSDICSSIWCLIVSVFKNPNIVRGKTMCLSSFVATLKFELLLPYGRLPFSGICFF